jgi:hypothetical protein
MSSVESRSKDPRPIVVMFWLAAVQIFVRDYVAWKLTRAISLTTEGLVRVGIVAFCIF